MRKHKKKTIFLLVLAVALIIGVIVSQINYEKIAKEGFATIGIPEMHHSYVNKVTNSHESLISFAFSATAKKDVVKAMNTTGKWAKKPVSDVADAAMLDSFWSDKDAYPLFSEIPKNSKIESGKWRLDKDKSGFLYSVFDLENCKLYIYRYTK